MKIKKLLAIFLFILILLPSSSFAAIPTPNPGGMFSSADLMKVVTNVANFILALIAVLGIIFIVWGSIQYVTSAGDEGRAEDAKNTIMYAALGLFIAALAYAIEDLVLTRLLA